MREVFASLSRETETLGQSLLVVGGEPVELSDIPALAGMKRRVSIFVLAGRLAHTLRSPVSIAKQSQAAPNHREPTGRLRTRGPLGRNQAAVYKRGVQLQY